MPVEILSKPVPCEKFVAPVPRAVLVPRTETSLPLNAADRQTTPVDLSAFGYAEEEYFVSGEANVYRWAEGERPAVEVKVRNAPYAVRCLVRKPADRRRFSGNVCVEMMNYAAHIDNPGAGWGSCGEYYLSRGDVWVGLSIRQCCVEAMLSYDRERYAPLTNGFANPIPPELRGAPGAAYDFPPQPDYENGLSYDAMSQLAMLLRSGNADSPLYGYDVRRLYGTGASAGDMTAYAGGVHQCAMRDGENHVFDGFVIYMTGAPANLNNEEKNLLVPDPRCVTYPEVPCIRVLTMGDILGKGMHPDWGFWQRRPDGDSAGDRFRIYELAGATLGYREDKSAFPGAAECERAGVRYRDPRSGSRGALLRYVVPTQFFLRAAFDNLKEWVDEGIAPPKGVFMGTVGGYPDTDFELDADGNVTKGVRGPHVDAPIAVYGMSGSIVPFEEAELRRRYGTKLGYVKAVATSVQAKVKERYILLDDGLRLLQEAIDFDFGFDW